MIIAIFGLISCQLVLTQGFVPKQPHIIQNASTGLFATLSAMYDIGVEIAVAAIPGVDSDRPQKVNQDSYFHTSFKDKVVVGVLDGHGLHGHLVSQYVAAELPIFLEQQFDQLRPIPDMEEQLISLGKAESIHPDIPFNHKALICAFHQVHHAATMSTTVPAGRSGTTCISCVIHDKGFDVAFVGDSRAIQIEQGDFSPPTVRVLAYETRTNIASERERIDSCQGRMDGEGNVWYGPVAIAMTRALGDVVMLRAGILPTPLIVSRPREACTLVIATDGVWDVLSNDDVRDIVVANGESISAAANHISSTARRKWIGDFFEEKADDVTCVVVRLT